MYCRSATHSKGCEVSLFDHFYRHSYCFFFHFISSSFILGSTTVLRLKYEVTNHGESAYLPQLNVTSSSRLNFAQIPGNCKVSEDVMICDLNNGRPLGKGDMDSITISFDVSSLTGSFLTISAEVFSTGFEKNPTDNKLSSVIALKEYTEIDASG